MTRMGRPRRAARAAALALAAAVPLAAPQALTASFVTKVTRTLNTPDGEFGSCMVALAESPMDHGLDCPPGRWVTIDCAGQLEPTDRLAALATFETAQMALIADRTVRVWVDDTHKIAGWCRVKRLDVW